MVEEVGEGVTRLRPGGHVVCSFLPVCGHCRFCARGLTNLCDLGALLVDNCLPDGTFRFHSGGEDLGQMCLLGTFSQWATVSAYSCVKIDDDLPLEVAVLVGCGVPTGWGTAVNAGGVRPGDTVAVYGIGGVAINAIQGGADEALVTVGVVSENVVSAAFSAIRKHGTVVVTGLAGPEKKTIHVSGGELTLFEKRIQGALFGGGNPFDDIPLMLDLYRSGRLKLDELVTSHCRLDEVKQGYRDLLDGKNGRGVLIHEH